jgi:hypothetical protein
MSCFSSGDKNCGESAGWGGLEISANRSMMVCGDWSAPFDPAALRSTRSAGEGAAASLLSSLLTRASISCVIVIEAFRSASSRFSVTSSGDPRGEL